MNIGKTVAIAGMFAVSAVPLAASAGPAQALDACLESYVETYVPAGHPIKLIKQRERRAPFTEFSQSSGPYTIAIEARGTESGKLYGSARCIADARGHVIVMDTPPPHTYRALATFTAVLARG
ncbi:MAG: hypothetical protein DIU71_07210 [Proteobacteria bacterium]|nr:MAG: hypothetical protein DIU71_07210 [Pseudomonadota bacterium]